jgi:Family of unknown function (DUF6270)
VEAARRTVAIWGSCVSRDAFALESRADELARRLPVIYYGARSSWISQASRPWPEPEKVLASDLGAFGRRMVAEDLAKTIVDRLARLQPDLLVMDLIDERIQLARFGRTWVTVSEYLTRGAWGAGALAEADEVSSVTHPRRRRLFAAAVRRLCRRLVRELPRTTFVLNEAPYSTRVADGTSLPEPRAGWARQLDAAQRPMLATLIEEFGSRLVRATPPPEVCLVAPDHRWGLASYHFVDDYNHWLIDTVSGIESPRLVGSIRPATAAAPRRLVRARPVRALLGR